MPRSDVVRVSGISKPTVNEVVETLLAEGLITESLDGGTERPRRPGPRARLLQFNSRRRLVVGVDVEASRILALLSDLDGTILGSARRPTPHGGRQDEVLRAVRQTVRDVVAQGEADWSAVRAVVVGTPGIVDRESGTVRLVPQLSGWEGRPLARLLSEALAAPVLLEHDVHLAVIGEYWRGVAAGLRNAAYVQIDVGVGMGFLIDGTVYAGADGAAGEVGYLPVVRSRPATGTAAGLGPFEAAAGATAFSALAAEAIARGEETSLRPSRSGEITAASVLAAARDGDRTAAGIVDTVLGHLAGGLASIAAVLNPEIVVLGGEVGEQLGAYLPRLQQQLDAAVPAPPRVHVTSLEDQAIALGAVRRGIDTVERQIFDQLGGATG
ncbi:ROK family protein [Jiangella ureilytica]|uniref:ROK family protein n=1 Tax=Jiangella ureilytica TaxID=2530374 RepID=A0A4R4REW0_9ACTN|nr:ROK family protein [Jiangella ureilytica]TDC47888.1 ROK family protein [Jiangella ureilytica]